MKISYESKIVRNADTKRQSIQRFVVFTFSDGFKARYPFSAGESLAVLIGEMKRNNPTSTGAISNDYKAA